MLPLLDSDYWGQRDPSGLPDIEAAEKGSGCWAFQVLVPMELKPRILLNDFQVQSKTSGVAQQ